MVYLIMLRYHLDGAFDADGDIFSMQFFQCG